MPVYIRGGEIIARRERTRRSTDAMINDPYTLVVAVAWNGNAAHARSKYVAPTFELEIVVYTVTFIVFNYKDAHFSNWEKKKLANSIKLIDGE